MQTLFWIQSLEVSPLQISRPNQTEGLNCAGEHVRLIICLCTNCVTLFRGADLVMLGVGYHHAGVDLSDRKLIEKAFTQADLPVLCES